MWAARVLSSEVERILSENPRGKVHSVFTNSFNLQFGDRLVHIGACENGIAPFGIGLDRMDARNFTHQIRIGQSVRWDMRDRRLVFTGAISLTIARALTKDYKLISSPYKPFILKKNAEYVVSYLDRNEWQTGLVQSDDEKGILMNYLSSSSVCSSSHPILKKIKDLEALAQGKEATDADSVFDYWIGRGPGLTPSGDDAITGMCAILSVLDGTNKTLLIQLESYLARKGRQRTTPIGYEYLTYASRREFHSHIKQLSQLLLEPEKRELFTAMEKVEGFGHTSGTDTLIGLLLGLRSVIY